MRPAALPPSAARLAALPGLPSVLIATPFRSGGIPGRPGFAAPPPPGESAGPAWPPGAGPAVPGGARA